MEEFGSCSWFLLSLELCECVCVGGHAFMLSQVKSISKSNKWLLPIKRKEENHYQTILGKYHRYLLWATRISYQMQTLLRVKGGSNITWKLLYLYVRMVKCWQFYLVHPMGAKGQEEKNKECPDTWHVCRFHFLLEVLWLTRWGVAHIRCTTVWTECPLCVCHHRPPLCNHCQVINGKWAHISCRVLYGTSSRWKQITFVCLGDILSSHTSSQF